MWAHRCSHEASQWEHNTFVTLTFDDEHVPQDGALNTRELQLFVKRVRKHARSRTNNLDCDASRRVRLFGCGEYGTQGGRPHYHAILFNCGFRRDRTRVGTDKNGQPLYTSETLARLWNHQGYVTLGDATPASANYIAQYTLKKQGRYLPWNPETGQAGRWLERDGRYLPAPFLRMSLRPAIGATWLDRYKKDLTHGYLVQDGRQVPIPRYYKKRLKELYPELHDEIDWRSYLHRVRNPSDSREPARLAASEIIHRRYKELTEQRA